MPKFPAFRRQKDGKMKTKLAALTAILAVTCLVATTSANAYGYVGPFYPAVVNCSTLDHRMTLAAQVGASSAFTGQSVGWRYYIKNIDTGYGFWTGWTTRWHQRVEINPGGFTRTTDLLQVGTVDYRWLAPGHYHVYTEYAWYDGGWFYRGAWTRNYSDVWGLAVYDHCTI